MTAPWTVEEHDACALYGWVAKDARPEHDGTIPINAGVKPGDKVVAEIGDQAKDGQRVQ